MSYDYDLIAHTCSSQEILRVFLEQNAEIERLKAVIESQNYSIDKHLGLITELCDALKARNQLGDTQQYLKAVTDLLQRGREATR
jgi:hypothetical protein